MRIACILTVFPSVAETFVFADLRALKDAGHEIGILHFLDGDERVWQEDARHLRHEVVHGGPLISLGVLRDCLFTLLRQPVALVATLAWTLVRRPESVRGHLKTMAILPKCVQFAAQCRRWKADHVHATWANHAAVAALVIERLVGIPFSVSAHAGQDVFREPVMLREKVGRARFIAVCNRASGARIREIGGVEVEPKLHHVSHGVHLERFPCRDRSPAEAGQEGGRILFVGRLHDGKGLPSLVRAAEILRDRGRKCRFDLVGDGPERTGLHEQIERNGLGDRVFFHGAVEQNVVAEFLVDADLLVLPAEIRPDGGREGLPNVILEAMARGVPVVASRVSAVEEAVEDGESGILVPPRDPEALADAMERILDDPALARHLSRAGRRIVEERFDRRRCMERFVGLFGGEP